MRELWPWLVMGTGVMLLLLREVFRRFPIVLPAGYSGDELPELKRPRTRTRARPTGVGKEWMPIVVSVLVLLAALYVILSRDSYPDAQQKWAFGAIGTILGYWFKR